MLELEGAVRSRKSRSTNGGGRSKHGDVHRDTVVLYVDGSKNSNEAARILRATGLRLQTFTGPIAPYHWPPIAVFHGGAYEGVPAIRRLVDSIRGKHAE